MEHSSSFLGACQRVNGPYLFKTEAMRMEALAEMAEDEIPDGGAIEVDLDEVYEE